MNLLKYKGNRIRASDQHLVYRFCIGTLILLFFVIVAVSYTHLIQLACRSGHDVMERTGETYHQDVFNFLVMCLFLTYYAYD